MSTQHRGAGARRGHRAAPIAMGLVALGLMVAVLPSSLHVPLTGPGGQAEVAPVPGQGNASSNLAALGLAESGGAASDGSGAVADGTLAGLSPRDQYIPPNNPVKYMAEAKGCVGTPARQTEDPLSPPCVPNWAGTDNGGTTTQGVDSKSITVVDTSAYAQDRDYSLAADPSDSPYTRTFRVLLRYYMSRYETYNRTVRIVGYRKTSGGQNPSDIKQKYNPFGVLDTDATQVNPAYARAGIDDFYAGGLSTPSEASVYPLRADLAAAAPRDWSLPPTIEDLTTSAAHQVCRSLVNKPPALANDPTIAARPTRRMAIISTSASDKFARNLDAATATLCGYHFAKILSSGKSVEDGSIANSVAQASADQDTTIVCFPCSVGGSQYWTKVATQQRYFPEYVFVGGDNIDPASARLNDQAQWKNATGISWTWRQSAMTQTYWWQAYASVDPSGTPDGSFGYEIYEELMQLFAAIQLGGPRLTPGSLEAGMDSWHRPSSSPYSPSATYTAAAYSFVQDAMWLKWDPAGITAGDDSGNAGCYRLVDDGNRFDPQHRDWPTSDDAVPATQWPCQPAVNTSADITIDSEAPA